MPEVAGPVPSTPVDFRGSWVHRFCPLVCFGGKLRRRPRPQFSTGFLNSSLATRPLSFITLPLTTIEFAQCVLLWHVLHHLVVQPLPKFLVDFTNFFEVHRLSALAKGKSSLASPLQRNFFQKRRNSTNLVKEKSTIQDIVTTRFTFEVFSRA